MLSLIIVLSIIILTAFLALTAPRLSICFIIPASVIEIVLIELMNGTALSLDDVILGGMMTGWLLRFAMQRSVPGIFWILAPFLLACFASVLLSIDYAQSAIALVKLGGFLVTVMVITTFPPTDKQILFTLATTIGITLAIMILQASGVLIGAGIKPAGGFYDWNYTPIACAMFIFILSKNTQIKNNDLFTAMIFGLILASVCMAFLAGSRSGAAIFLVSMMIWGLCHVPGIITEQLKKPIVSGTAVVAGVLIATGFLSTGNMDNILKSSELQSRFLSIALMLKCWNDFVWTGCGFGAWNSCVEATSPDIMYQLDDRFGTLWLIAAEVGIFGIITYIYIYASLFQSVLNKNRDRITMAFLVSLAVASMGYTIHHHWFTWIALGLAITPVIYDARSSQTQME